MKALTEVIETGWKLPKEENIKLLAEDSLPLLHIHTHLHTPAASHFFFAGDYGK